MSASKQSSHRNSNSSSSNSLSAKLSLGIRTSKSAELPKRAPTALAEMSRLAAGVVAVASGSATGNPRNKCALQPGHSLMDWIRLGSSGRDLSGVGTKAGTLCVTPRELSTHSTLEDAWLAIRGRVYNVTEYLPFHPGGPDELMRGVGKDATKLFDQVHPWVNYESILQRCYIGRLVATEPEIDTSQLLFGSNTLTKPVSKIPKTCSSAPTSPNRQIAQSNSAMFGAANKDKALPKFDWIQKTDSVTFIFYTKPYTNVWLNVSCSVDRMKLKISMLYSDRTVVNEIELDYTVKWPCRTSHQHETGKIEVLFLKNESKIWPDFGHFQQRCEDSTIDASEAKYECIIVGRIKVSHNTFLLILRRTDTQMDIVPIGYHLRIYVQIRGEEHYRNYTPVPPTLVKRHEPLSYSHDCVCFMVKTYPDGLVSPTICSTSAGGTLDISAPLGTFRLPDLETKDRFLLIAAGTGVTPMFGIISFVLGRRIRKCHKVKLLFFNRTEEDILWKDQLDELCKEDNRFLLESVLSEANEDWDGKKGKVNKQILQSSLEDILTSESTETKDTSSTYVCICGPSAFTQLTEKLLVENVPGQLQISSEQVHSFLG